MKNEKTSARVASSAGRILEAARMAHPEWTVLAMSSKFTAGIMELFANIGLGSGKVMVLCDVKELKAVAASALTQTPDHPKKRKVKRER